MIDTQKIPCCICKKPTTNFGIQYHNACATCSGEICALRWNRSSSNPVGDGGFTHVQEWEDIIKVVLEKHHPLLTLQADGVITPEPTPAPTLAPAFNFDLYNSLRALPGARR